MNIPSSTLSNSEDETALIAHDFSHYVQTGRIVVLNGDLGSGKTFFIKKVLENFKIRNVNSPSFAIVNEYNGTIKAYHFDFFRLNKIQELYDIGWNDYLNDDDAVMFVEWGNLLFEALPDRRIEINISILGERKRKFEFAKYE